MVLLEVVAAVVVVVTAVWVYSKYKFRYWEARGLPSAPSPLPVLGHLHNAVNTKKHSWIYINEVRRMEGCSSILSFFSLRFLSPNVSLV